MAGDISKEEGGLEEELDVELRQALKEALKDNAELYRQAVFILKILQKGGGPALRRYVRELIKTVIEGKEHEKGA
ncbi:MAG: hypothetical protein J7L11_08030 [Thermoprotei archaeon]|nr:hypothetical protein [Thermoprotei archaeon]